MVRMDRRRSLSHIYAEQREGLGLAGEASPSTSRGAPSGHVVPISGCGKYGAVVPLDKIILLSAPVATIMKRLEPSSSDGLRGIIASRWGYDDAARHALRP